MQTVLTQFENLAQYNPADYQNAQPYPHIVIDNFLAEDVAHRLLEEFVATKGEGKVYYRHFNEDKTGFTNLGNMGPTTRQVITELCSEPFLGWLGRMTGVPDIIPDFDLDGGGLHEMKREGFLNIHTDFQSHTVHKTWSRKCNLIYFLNKDWADEYEGFLELWDKDVKNRIQNVKPIFNRAVIFNTTDISFHGVPQKIMCPEGQSRKSLALYYFQDTKKTCRLKPTNYQPLPEDSFSKRTKIYADRSLVWAYSFAKRYLGASDDKVSKILKTFSRQSQKGLDDS